MADDGGNGEVKKEEAKTPEQIAQERLERYQKDPISFIEISEVIACAIRSPSSSLGIMVYIGICRRSELNNAEAEISHIIRKHRMQMDMEMAKKQEAAKNLITPQNKMYDFLRRRK